MSEDTTNESRVYQVLDELGIPYEKLEHEAAFTVEQAEDIYGHLTGAHTKNLFLRNKKGDRHYLLVAQSRTPVDLKSIRVLLEESSLSFASPERLKARLGLTPGSVSPFGLINDTAREVSVLLDEALSGHDMVNFHPNRNTATLTLSHADFRRFLEHTGHSVRLVRLVRSATPDNADNTNSTDNKERPTP